MPSFITQILGQQDQDKVFATLVPEQRNKLIYIIDRARDWLSQSDFKGNLSVHVDPKFFNCGVAKINDGQYILIIGLPIVNELSKEELACCIAHEIGHIQLKTKSGYAGELAADSYGLYLHRDPECAIAALRKLEIKERSDLTKKTNDPVLAAVMSAMPTDSHPPFEDRVTNINRIWKAIQHAEKDASWGMRIDAA